MRTLIVSLFILFYRIVFCQTPTPQPTPPIGGQNSTNFDQSTKICIFSYTGNDGTLSYTYSPTQTSGDNGSLNALTASIGSSFTFWPSFNGGIAIQYNSQLKNPWEHTYQLDTIYLSSNYLYAFFTLTAHFKNTDVLYHYNYIMHIDGRTLIINVGKVGSDVDCAAEFNLDRSNSDVNLYPSYQSYIIGIPYLTLFNVLYTGNTNIAEENTGVFTSMFFDWTSTNASKLIPRNTVYSNTSVFYSQEADYLPKTNGSLNPLNETIYLTVSPKLEDVFPNIPNPTSPRKDQSVNNIVWDYWKEFNTARNYLDSIYNLNLDNLHLWLIFHKWDQSCGSFNTMPDFMDACQGWGGNDSLLSLRNYAVSNGSLFTLHEDYIEYYTSAPTYNTSKLSLNSQGQYIVSWPNPLAYCIKPTEIFNIMNDPTRAPAIHNTFHTTAGFLDVHSSYDPSEYVDYDYTQTNAGKFTEAFQINSQIAGAMRNYCDGPVSGEGLAHFLYTGYYDDFEAQIHTGQSLPGFRYVGTDRAEVYGGYYKPLLVDFDLRKMREKTFVHGVGYFDRFFFNTNYQQYGGISIDSILMYTATELAYAHGGFFSTGTIHGPFNVLEQTQIQYKHVYPMQSLYAYAGITSILYNDDGILLTASDYIKKYPDKFNCFPGLQVNCDGYNFMSQVRIEYDNGLIVCVNRHPTKTWIISDIPTSGWYNYHVLGMPRYTGNTGLAYYYLPPGNGWVCYSPNSPQSPNKNNVLSKSPFKFSLAQNYPNPFNPITKIKYEVAKNVKVTLKIYDILGKLVSTLVNNELKEAGPHEVDWNASNYASGVYFYRIVAGNNVAVKKMVLIK